MHTPDLLYMWHQMRDIAISMWQLSPPMIVAIFVVLSGTTYFVFKR